MINYWKLLNRTIAQENERIIQLTPDQKQEAIENKKCWICGENLMFTTSYTPQEFYWEVFCVKCRYTYAED